MQHMLMEARGKNGNIELYADRLVIYRKKSRGDKTILLTSITAVQFRQPGWLTVGYIRFAFSGGQEFKGNLQSAARDENAILFGKKSSGAFDELRQAVEDMMARPTERPRTNTLDEVERLADLKERGIITDEEFTAKKRQLLGL